MPPARAADKLTVVLDWFVNPDHGPLVIAREKGYFRDAGPRRRPDRPGRPNDPPKLVAAGKADIAVSYQPQLHLQVDQGLPLARIGTLVATPLDMPAVARPTGRCRRSRTSRAARSATRSAALEEALLGTMLDTAGLKLDDVQLVNVNFALSPALMSGQVDAVIGAFRNFELIQMA